MKLQDNLALQLRLAQAYSNTNITKLSKQTGICKTTISNYARGFIGQPIDNYATMLKALGFELEIKLKRRDT